MDQHKAMDRRYRSLTAATAAALVLAAGCAQTPPSSPINQTAAPDTAPKASAGIPALAPLLRAAADQAARPISRTLSAPPPPGVDPILGQKIPTVQEGGDPHALTPLLAALDTFATASRAATSKPAPPAKGPAAEQDAQTALRHYVAGREQLLNDNLDGALSELLIATRLDPDSGEPWRELGDALMRSGSRPEAVEAFMKSAAAGLEDARVLEMLGRDALDRGDVDAAAGFLARAALAAPEQLDPFLPQVIDVALSRVLAEKGYVAAAREALVRVADRPMQLSASTRYGNEYGTIFRRQGELWRDIGDASCRLGRYSEAFEAYQRSAELPSLDPESPSPRLVFAAMRSGQPAAAAVEVLRDVFSAGGAISDRDLGLLRYIASTGSLGTEIASALGQFQASLKSVLPPSVASSLARARAAVAPGAAGASILREQLGRDPHDIRAAAELFASLESAATVAADAAALVSAHPGSAPSIAEAILRTTTPDAVASLDRASPRPAATLTQAYVKSRRGEVYAAANLAATLPMTGRTGPAAALARVELGVDAARPEMIQEGLTSLATLTGPAPARAYAKSLLLLQRCEAGLAAIRPLLSDPAVSPAEHLDDLLLAANLALALGQSDAAERWLLQAAALDPVDDRAPSGLLGLYGAGGAKADPTRMNQVARDLRQSIPDSRTLRLVRTQELLRRSLFAQAEAEAAQLADEDPADPAPIDLLVAAWLRQTGEQRDEAIERGRRWLELRLARRPLSPPLVAGITALLAESGHPGEAETRLRSMLATGGGPDISRLLERVLRKELGRGDEADVLALARLEGRARTPGEAIELAEIYTRQHRDADAAATLRASLPSSPPVAVAISDLQGQKLVAIASELAERADQGADATARSAAVEVLDLAAQRGLTLAPELHERRLVLLAATPDIDAARMLKAAALTAQQHPTLTEAAYVRASRALTQAGRGPVAIDVIAKAAELAPGPETYFEWFRVVATEGRAPLARQLIESAQRAGRLRELVERLARNGDGAAAPADYRAETAYTLGNVYASNQRPDEADAAYELALEYDPGHPWACNNLGYSLTERGIQLDRAAMLLERAHKALPEEASITDSLGWLRYKQGILDDRKDPVTGLVVTQGAISLLQRAVGGNAGIENPIHLDHLGDALWQAGRRDDAQRAWERTESAVQRILRGAGRGASGDQSQLPSPAAIEEYRKLRDSASAKRRAARAGEAVGVAPQFPGLGGPVPEPGAPTGPTGDSGGTRGSSTPARSAAER